MKRQIRQGVFETNSSSTHSVTIYYNYDFLMHTEADEDGDIYLTPGDVYDIILNNIQDFTIEQLEELVNRKRNEKSSN